MKLGSIMRTGLLAAGLLAGAAGSAFAQGAPIKIGILHSLSGTMAISETTLKDVMLMLIEEQNKKGGVLGRKLEAVVVDPASNWPLFAEKARELLQKDKVAAVFGCWTSVSRKSVLPVFEELNGLLFYPVQYEGEESQRNVFYTGAAPNQQAIPAVDYLMANEKVQRWVPKRVRPRHGRQDPPGLLATGQLAGGLGVDPLQDGRAQQQVPDLRRHGAENLVHQVAGQGAVIGDQLLDELLGVLDESPGTAARRRPAAPAFRPPGQALQRVRRQSAAVLGQEQAGFGGAEGDVAGPDLGQLARQPVAVQRQQRKGPRTANQAQAGPQFRSTKSSSPWTAGSVSTCRSSMTSVTGGIWAASADASRRKKLCDLPPAPGRAFFRSGNSGPAKGRDDIGPKIPAGCRSHPAKPRRSRPVPPPPTAPGPSSCPRREGR